MRAQKPTTPDQSATDRPSAEVVMKRLILYLGLVFLFGRDVGKIEAEKFDALKGPVTGGVYGGALRGSQKSTARAVAYRECMYRYGYRP